MACFQKQDKWYIDYYFKGKRIREAIGSNHKAAEKALATRKTEILQGRYRWIQEKRSVQFKDFSISYLAYSKNNKRAWLRDYTSLTHIIPFFDGKSLGDISSWMVEQYKQKRIMVVKPATVNRELTTLKNMFTMAIKWNQAEKNPVKEVKLLRVEEKVERVLSPQEEEKLLGNTAPHLQPIIVTALNTGLRLGEILSLQWDNVDLNQKVIVVAHSKNGKVRKIPINKVLFSTLDNLKRENSHVFANVKTGKNYGSVKTAFRAAIRRAGIKHLRFHDLRHTFASRIVLKGVDLTTVAELLGHSSIKMTVRYAHPTPESKRNAVEVLEDYADQKFQDGHYLDTIEDSTRNSLSLTT
jgi:integrase